MKLASGENVLTLKDIAKMVAFSDSETNVSRAMRQIRHWTQNDLLKTVSEKSTGKGIPRLYAEDPTLDIAAILMELSRLIPAIEVLKPVADDLYESWEGSHPYLHSALADDEVFLQVYWNTDPDTGSITGVEFKFWDERDDLEDRMPNPAPACSVLINMARVADRIYGVSRSTGGSDADE